MDIAKRVTPVQGGLGFSTPLVAGACAVYGATVAARLGGTWREVAAASLAGLIGGTLHGNALGRRSAALSRTFATALSATLAVLAFLSASSAAHLGRALCGGLAVLAPVALLAIAAGEMAGGAAASSLLRLAEAALRVAALALGVVAAFAIETRLTPVWATVGLSPAAAEPAALALPFAVVLAALGGLALTVCLQARWRDAPFAVAGVLVAWAAQAFGHVMFGPAVGVFLSAFVVGVVAIVAGRIFGRTPALMIVPGLMQLGTACFGSEALLRLVGSASFGDGGMFPLFFPGFTLVSGLILAETAFRRLRRAGEV